MLRVPTLLAAVFTAACGTQVIEVEEIPLTVTVAGYVTIDEINPAYGVVAVLDPDGTVIGRDTIDRGRYRISRILPEGVDVCDGYTVFTEIIEDVRNRTQSRRLASSSGDCIISSETEIVHHVDLDFPLIVGLPD